METVADNEEKFVFFPEPACLSSQVLLAKVCSCDV